MVKLENATAPVVHQGFVRELKSVPEYLRKSLTYDRGKELALHKNIAIIYS
jgi:IS30 family transposase